MKINSGLNKPNVKPKKRNKKSISFSFLNRFGDKHKEEFYREFSTLINSGVDFNQALNILATQQKSKFLFELYNNINIEVVKGKSLYETVKDNKYFTPYEFYSIKIGEETRRLPEVFKQLETFFSRKKKMKRQIASVLTYPLFVLIFTFGVLYFMLNFVVPMFSTVFQQFGKKLPKITQFVVNVSENFNFIMLIIFVIISSIIFGHKFLKENVSYKTFTCKLILAIPFFGDLINKIYLARFCQSLSLLLSAKTPLITALELTEKMISFYPLKSAIKKTKMDVLKGESFASSLKKHSFFNPKIISLTAIGEEINELDKMYDGLAVQYNEDIDHSTKMIGTILEPIMIVLIGSIVGFIMVAMYSPIFDLSKVIQN